MRPSIFLLIGIAVFISVEAAVGAGMPSFSVEPAGMDSTALRDTTTAADSLSAAADSAAKVYVVRDSTYLHQLTYHRTPSVTATPFPSANPFYLKTPTIVQRIVKLDSTGQYVIVREMVAGKDVAVPVKMPLEEYIKMRSREDIRNNYREMISKEDEGAKKKDALEGLLGSFTNIDIPIPANPVFSIFGPPRINLIISGAVDIRAAFRNTVMDQQTTSILGNSRNEPDFAQEVQVNVNGTIGDKLNINADWNTQRTFEYENQLKIKYTGYEDEIVQSVEAGNVSLTTNSAFISSSSALFGIKAGFQIGPLKLTAIASQKKGEIQEKTVTGGAQEREYTVRAWQYSKDHFFIDTVYSSTYERYVQDNVLQYPQLQVKDNEFEVWVTHTGIEDPMSRQANAFLNLPPIAVGDTAQYRKFRTDSTTIPGLTESGVWDKLEPDKDYTINLDAGYITLNRSIQDGQAVAIAYRIENGAGPQDDLVYGTLKETKSESDSVLVLKLIKPKNLKPQFEQAWSLMMKNFYFLGGTNVKESGFTLSIKYEQPGQEPTESIGKEKWIRVFGFDNYTAEGTKGTNDAFDYRPNYTIDEKRGEVIFPTLKPFTDGIRTAFKQLGIDVPDTSYLYDNLYDTTQNAAQNNSLRDRFIITGKITAATSNTINLGFNIVEGSVQVLLDGRPLTPNVDYTVDYIIGQVIIKNQAALVPGANMQVKYEQNDLFQLASKTLLGTRGELKVSDQTFLGFTIMNLDQQTLSDKVRLGEEPINNTMYGFDGQTAGEIPFLTKAIDALPFIDTKAKSEFTLKGEAAYMSPDPNTKKSTITGDNGKSIAYIDDFEGSKRVIPLGVGYGQWHDMSAPWYQSNVDLSVTNVVPDTTKIKSKGRTYWFNYSNVHVNDIYGYDAEGNPIKSVGRGQDLVTVMNIDFNPRLRGAYNFSEDLRSTLLADPTKNWGGVQRIISGSAIDLVQENISFIEVWVKIEKGSIDTTRKIYIDLGAINEDVIPNKKLDTEDKGAFKDGLTTDAEDTGLDGLFDADERSAYASFLSSNRWDADTLPNPSADPAGDDYAYVFPDFRFINGSERNRQSEIGQFSNTEDLNNNNVLDRVNSYFEYELNLDTTEANPQRVGGGNNGWYQYRIPIATYKNVIGSPDQSLIEYARIWFTGFDHEVEIRMTDFNLIGNQWEEVTKGDSTMKLSVVNIEDNTRQGYTSPPGVFRERDRTQPDQQVYANEQSLAMNIRDLKDGDNRKAIKRYSYRPLDVFSYKELKMFVHGDESFSSDPSKPTAKVFIRFGTDSLNYYEYKAPIYPGWDLRNDIDVRFEDVTALKQARDSVNQRWEEPVSNGPPGATYAVQGNPTLTRITTIYIGVENPIDESNASISGEVWVNELRLVDVDNTPGWAYSVSSSVKLADLGSVAFTYSQVDPFFHSLENKFGGRVTTTNWSLASNFSFEKFLPQSWSGTTLPLSYSHTEQVLKPRYLPSSDIVVTKAAEQQAAKVGGEAGKQEQERIITESQTLTSTDTYALPNIKVNVPSNLWLFRSFLNRISYSFNFTTSSFRSPTVTYRSSWQWNARIAYAYTFDPDYFFQPFAYTGAPPLMEEFKNFQLYYFPITNISADFGMSRSRTREQLRAQSQPNNPLRGLSSTRSLAFGWKLTEGGLLNLSGDYQVNITSSLVHLEIDRFGRQRSFEQILENMFNVDQLVNFGYDNNYNQSVNVNMRPRVPPLWGLNKYITLGSRYSVSYRWQNNLQQGDLGIGTGWGNTISFNFDLSLKSFVETWFPAAPAESPFGSSVAAPSRGRRGHDGDEAETKEDQEQPADTSAAPEGKKPPGEGVLNIARMLIKTPLLDYDKISITFSQTNSAQNNGVPGRPGFANFFGRVPFVQQADRHFGPSRAYQLGLVSVPSANITDVFVKSSFPFIGFSTDADKQIRARNSPNLTDAFSQGNKLTLRTSRDLWKGAHIDLNWSLGWDYSKNQRLSTDSLGRPTIVSTATGGSIERSFFTLPPTLIFSVFKSGIEDVGKKYLELYNDKTDTRTEDQKLAQAFEDGMESLPLLKKIFGQYFPRVNYTFRWDGLEELGIFKKFATRVSLDHAYQSSYKTSFKGSTGSPTTIESQRISYGFSPLIGLNISFKEVMKGTMSANARYGTTVAYDLTPTSKNIVESGSNDISLTASFARQGFEIPLFGLSLKNDIDISLSYSYAKNNRTTYDAKGDSFNGAGTPGEGSSRTQLEPRIKYVLSSRVTASVFYRYTKITPDAGGSRIPGSTSNEGGLDVHISIQ